MGSPSRTVNTVTLELRGKAHKPEARARGSNRVVAEKIGPILNAKRARSAGTDFSRDFP
jgi:hypothetical protein